MKNQLVEFEGTRYWLLSKDVYSNGQAVAPLEHCDAEGNVICLDVSFAHLYDDGRLIRFGTQIGIKDDLTPVEGKATK